VFSLAIGSGIEGQVIHSAPHTISVFPPIMNNDLDPGEQIAVQHFVRLKNDAID
jgi:hypothetical protein